MLWRKGHYWCRSAPRARNDADHTLLPVAVLAGCKGPGDGQMISAVECREHAVEWRGNRENDVFDFDFGHDTTSVPSVESILASFGR